MAVIEYTKWSIMDARIRSISPEESLFNKSFLSPRFESRPRLVGPNEWFIVNRRTCSRSMLKLLKRHNVQWTLYVPLTGSCSECPMCRSRKLASSSRTCWVIISLLHLFALSLKHSLYGHVTRLNWAYALFGQPARFLQRAWARNKSC